MRILKEIIKKVAFSFFPHIQHYNERISNLEVAVTAIANAPEYVSDENSLNKQLRRKELVVDILNALKPQSIVETGTHLGDSTGFFSKFSNKVYTSDISPIYMWAAKVRLSKITNINFFIGDSREFLMSLTKDSLVTSGKTFFYLDAHWHEDLPLHEELKIVSENWSAGNWIVLIDDFCVPGDSGYAYPSYGPNKTLNYDYVKNLVEDKGLNVFFPTIPSNIETGYKTGYVFISNGGSCLDILKKNIKLKQLI